MKNVILTRGLPASGKSTWARAEQARHPGRYKVINKDSLRAMLDGGRYSKPNEAFVLNARNALILQALSAGCSVIVDDTNLNPVHEQTIRDLVRGVATVEVKDFTDVALETCIMRDLQRERSVGERVIRRMYRQFVQPRAAPPAYDPALSDALICDLDGTLAVIGDRDPYDASKCEGDQVNEAVRTIIASVPAYVILVSGRSVRYRAETERWLQRHGIAYLALYMRPDGDSRKDAVMKRELYERYIAGKYNVLFVLDDRDQMIRLWREELGLVALQVAEGDF